MTRRPTDIAVSAGRNVDRIYVLCDDGEILACSVPAQEEVAPWTQLPPVPQDPVPRPGGKGAA